MPTDLTWILELLREIGSQDPPYNSKVDLLKKAVGQGYSALAKASQSEEPLVRLGLLRALLWGGDCLYAKASFRDAYKTMTALTPFIVSEAILHPELGMEVLDVVTFRWRYRNLFVNEEIGSHPGLIKLVEACADEIAARSDRTTEDVRTMMKSLEISQRVPT